MAAKTDDALLGEIQAAWGGTRPAEQQERLLLQVERDRHAVRAEFIRRERVELGRQQRAMDRYLAGWRRWLDRHAERGGWPDRDG